MINEQLREQIREVSEDALLFDNPSFDDSIIGMSHDGAVIYDKRKMIEEYAKENNCSEEDALEFIEYNTERAMPYFAQYGVTPVILDDDCIRYEVEMIEGAKKYGVSKRVEDV